MIFNLNGSLILTMIIETYNTTLILVYELIILAIILIGIVIMAIKARELIYQKPLKQLPKKGLFKTVFVNKGMILMYIAVLALVIVNLVTMVN